MVEYQIEAIHDIRNLNFIKIYVAKIAFFYMQSEIDKERIVSLGAIKEKLKM